MKEKVVFMECFIEDWVKYEINDIRNSGVIKKIDGNWKIVQIHWSIGVKGQVIEYEFQK